jgi:hypothetical protein
MFEGSRAEEESDFLCVLGSMQVTQSSTSEGELLVLLRFR